MVRYRFFLGLLLPCAVFMGCSAVMGTVIDHSNTGTHVTKMHLSGRGTIRIVSGAAVKDIPLESLESITLFPDEAQTFGGELCFLADITMRDGTKLDSKDKRRGDNAPKTYVSVNQTLTGTSHEGNFSVDLSGVSKIEFK